MQTIELTDKQKDFARYVGYEVKVMGDENLGINLGLHFSDQLAEAGVLKPEYVKIFAPLQNIIHTMTIESVELIFPAGETRMNPTEAIYGIMSWLTTRKHTLFLGGAHECSAVPDLIEHFVKVNNLPKCRENWTDFLIGMGDNSKPEEVVPNTKHTSVCLKKAADDEPIFVLRSTDPSAPKLVRIWASTNDGNGQPEDKIQGAYDVADQMESWAKEKNADAFDELPPHVQDQEVTKGYSK